MGRSGAFCGMEDVPAFVGGDVGAVRRRRGGTVPSEVSQPRRRNMTNSAAAVSELQPDAEDQENLHGARAA